MNRTCVHGPELPMISYFSPFTFHLSLFTSSIALFSTEGRTMTKTYSYNSFLYGVVYYPEQWPEERWESDLSRIAQTDMNVVRMGEGAWSVWEPEEGHYDFALFDRALGFCQKHELKAIMG